MITLITDFLTTAFGSVANAYYLLGIVVFLGFIVKFIYNIFMKDKK